MNFPYEDCNSNNECGHGFIFASSHVGPIIAINYYDSLLAYPAHYEANRDSLDNVIIRFNWHHKYGKPLHLKNLSCDASQENYSKWRETIDFSEVIDYCGVDVISKFKYIDLTILKMKQKPFYKEHHLGWSTQSDFDVSYENDTSFYSHPEKFLLLGRRSQTPTVFMKFNSIRLLLATYGFSDCVPTTWYYYLFEKGTEPLRIFEGYSGSQLLYDDFENLSIGIINRRDYSDTLEGQSKYSRGFNPDYYGYAFNQPSNKIYDCSTSTYIKFSDYLEKEIFNNPYNYNSIRNENFTYFCPHRVPPNDNYISGSYYWYPSADNKQKCPSNQGMSGGELRPCDFNIMDYVTWSFDENFCITIDTIPERNFPAREYPKGFRIYHNFSDQKTILYKSFRDTNDITFPIQACISQCDLLYLVAMGKENINIAIDFYDEFGRVFNNPGCDTLAINLPLPDICDLFNINIAKVDSTLPCCKYEISLQIAACGEYNPAFKEIISRTRISSFRSHEPEDILAQLNAKIDTLNSIVTFEYLVCESVPSDNPSNFRLHFSFGDFSCESDSIDFSHCSCNCKSQEEMNSWITTNISAGDSTSCPEDQCEITYEINIPSYFDCYQFFGLNGTNPMHKHPIPPTGSLVSYCLEAGEMRLDTFYLYRNFDDTQPCMIVKNAFCPIESEVQPCVPDCPEVGFDSWEGSFDIDGCPGCKVRYDFQSRRNTCYEPVKQDIQVTKFVVYSDDPSVRCDSCVVSAEDIYKLCLLDAIYENLMSFDPQKGADGCDTTWRVINSSCWKSFIEPNSDRVVWAEGPMLTYRPCDSTDCCKVGLMVCRYQIQEPVVGEYITIDTLSSTGSLLFCEGISDITFIYDPGYSSGHLNPGEAQALRLYRIETLDCFDRCSWLHSLTSPSYSGKRGAYPLEFKANLQNDKKVFVLISNDLENLKISIKSEIATESLLISLNSLHGNKLLKEQFNLLKGENYYQMSLKNLSSGLYLITIQVNGLILKTDKILITR